MTTMPIRNTSPTVKIHVQRALLCAGILSSALYVFTDLVSATLYPGYDIVDQAISELSAIGAPTAPLWAAMGPAYEVLFVAFGIGVLRAARENRRLRITGALLTAFGAAGVLWAFFPMHQRGGEAAMAATDIGHIALGVVFVTLYTTFIGVGAFALGRRFRVFSLVTMVVGFLTGASCFTTVPRLAAGESTPLLGIVERISIYGYLIWVAVLGIALLRSEHGTR